MQHMINTFSKFKWIIQNCLYFGNTIIFVKRIETVLLLSDFCITKSMFFIKSFNQYVLP